MSVGGRPARDIQAALAIQADGRSSSPAARTTSSSRGSTRTVARRGFGTGGFAGRFRHRGSAGARADPGLGMSSAAGRALLPRIPGDRPFRGGPARPTSRDGIGDAADRCSRTFVPTAPLSPQLRSRRTSASSGHLERDTHKQLSGEPFSVSPTSAKSCATKRSAQRPAPTRSRHESITSARARRPGRVLRPRKSRILAAQHADHRCTAAKSNVVGFAI